MASIQASMEGPVAMYGYGSVSGRYTAGSSMMEGPAKPAARGGCCSRPPPVGQAPSSYRSRSSASSRQAPLAQSRGTHSVETTHSVASFDTTSHRFTQYTRGTPGQAAPAAAKAWVTVAVPENQSGLEFRPRGFASEDLSSGGSTPWSVKSKYMMATRSGPTECPDHLLAKHKAFANELSTFPSPYALYYFDETAPNNILISNDLKLKGYNRPDYQRIPTRTGDNAGKGKDALAYDVRKLYFDVDDLRVPENGTGLKLLPGFSVSYKNYPAVCYDVITPKSYVDFFRTRQRPGFFA